MQSMMNNPQFLQQMSTMMSNPAIMDQVIAMNPQLQAVAPQVRAAFESPQFREIMYVYPPTLTHHILDVSLHVIDPTLNASNK
jgi:hypothetical protein